MKTRSVSDLHVRESMSPTSTQIAFAISELVAFVHVWRSLRPDELTTWEDGRHKHPIDAPLQL